MKCFSIVLLSLLWLASAKSFPTNLKPQRASRNATVERTRTLPILRAFVHGDETTASREEEAEAVLTSSIDDECTKQNLFILALMTLTGISEAICFLRFGCFLNILMGNFFWSTNLLGKFKFEKALFHAALIASYVAGGGVFTMMDDIINKKTYMKLPKDSKSMLPLVAGVSLVLFCGSDLLNKLTDNARTGLPILALGYGMINAATSAIAGHWTITGHRTKVVNGVSKAAVAAFCLFSVLSTGIVYIRIEERPALLARMPPFGTSFGLLYAILLTWYSPQDQVRLEQQDQVYRDYESWLNSTAI